VVRLGRLEVQRPPGEVNRGAHSDGQADITVSKYGNCHGRSCFIVSHWTSNGNLYPIKRARVHDYRIETTRCIVTISRGEPNDCPRE
jgi:hypothetical protein